MFFRSHYANASIEKKIDSNLSLISEKIAKEVSLRSELSMSSNPYDYIKDNRDFDAIVSLGNEAMPYLQNKIANSEFNGLEEYITAIAIEKIAKVNLKKIESLNWETAKGFNEKWKIHLASIPSKVDEVSSDTTLSSQEKVKKLEELGTPAIPFILDKVESGDETIFPAVVELTRDSGTGTFQDITNKKEWATEHKDQFKTLKEYVLEQK